MPFLTINNWNFEEPSRNLSNRTKVNILQKKIFTHLFSHIDQGYLMLVYLYKSSKWDRLSLRPFLIVLQWQTAWIFKARPSKQTTVEKDLEQKPSTPSANVDSTSSFTHPRCLRAALATSKTLSPLPPTQPIWAEISTWPPPCFQSPFSLRQT
jgi:hypothetical protein